MALELAELLGTFIVLVILIVVLPSILIGAWIAVSLWRVAGSKWFDRAVRSSTVLLVIPSAVLMIFIPLVAIALLTVPAEDHTFFVISALIVAILITIVLQGIHARNLTRDELQDHEMGFREYMKYIFGAGKRKEKARKIDTTARADKLYQFAASRSRRSVSSTIKDDRVREKIAVTGGAAGSEVGLIPRFSWSRKATLATFGAAQGLTLMLLVFSIFFWEQWPILAILFALWLIVTFLGVAPLTDDQESPALLFVAPLLGIFEFMLIAMILNVFPWLEPPGDYIFYAIALSVVYLFVAGTPTFLILILGRILFDSLLSRDLFPKSAARVTALVLGLVFECLVIITRFRLQFPNDEPLIGMIEFVAIGALTIALTAPKTRRRERQWASFIAPILGAFLLVIIGLLNGFYLVISPALGIILVTIISITDEAGLSGKNVQRQLCFKLVLLNIILISAIYYIGASLSLLMGPILVVILLMGAIMAYKAGGLKNETSLIISWVSIYFLVGAISLEFYPTLPEFEKTGIGWVSLPLSVAFWVALAIGTRLFEHYVHVGIDGHKLSSRGEMMVDSWLYKNSLAHEVHPSLIDPQVGEFRLSFRIPDRSPLYIQVWNDIRKETNMQHYRQISAAIERLGIKVIEVYPSETNLENLDVFLKPIKNYIKESNFK
ncbi:MAG: hypothetical protein ACE5OZ_20730 [Candidatus Heimdallarchaeota archaeon]